VGWTVRGAPAASVMRRGLSDDTLPAERRIQHDILVRIACGRLCVCRASMRTLLAGDTHARPPRGQDLCPPARGASMLLYLYCLDKILRLYPTAVAAPARPRHRQGPPAAAQEDI
jgi:hypothetical protein